MGNQHAEETCERCQSAPRSHQLSNWHRRAIAHAGPAAREQYLCAECFEQLEAGSRSGWFQVSDLMVD